MSEIIAALLGGLIAIIGYFAIIETIGFINQRRLQTIDLNGGYMRRLMMIGLLKIAHYPSLGVADKKRDTLSVINKH